MKSLVIIPLRNDFVCLTQTMVRFETLKKIAFSFPEVEEHPHFEKSSFRVKNRIFLTYDKEENVVTLKLNAIDQNVFSSYNVGVIYPVKNKWGKQGWTVIRMKAVRKNVLIDAVTTAYCEVAPKTLAKVVKQVPID